MHVPQLNNLLQILEDILEKFDPTTLTYLDVHGNWVRNPESLRDRISNELWYRIWEAKQDDNYLEQVKNVIEPFISDENSWDVTIKIFGGVSGRKGEARNLLIICEVLYLLIEYNVSKRNTETYVADWDFSGKVRREQYLVKVQKYLKNMYQILDGDIRINSLHKIINSLCEGKEDTIDKVRLLEGIFNEVSLIIEEEEKVRQCVSDLLIAFKNTKKEDEIFAMIDNYIDPDLGMMTGIPQALLRPCLELLSNPDIDISSGLQFKSSSVLGILRDLRSTDCLLNALESYELKYTNIRCNLIYAIGNLKQKKAIKHLINVLKCPDSVEVYPSSGSQGYKQPLQWEKYEAIWALGKLGAEAVEVIPIFMEYVNNPDRDLKLALAWAMGMIGKEQKEKYGGVDAGVVITLMNLLTAKESKIFEEVAFSLRKLDLPDFLHSLYLYNVATLPILALKPCSTGLYELSETIFYLMSLKKPVVMAVTGDSGTGKTYFCEAIKNGFGGLRKDELLYLMRDNPGHVHAFYKMLGIKLLKEHIDPQYYQDYPLTESEDNPDEFFDNFMREHSNKKLIILDGWLDKAYFYQVLKVFYENGYLDIVVNFRTTFSTKRFNLEEREGRLESVKTCLSCVEEPVIEKTEFYREGTAFVYNLDNSITSRLNSKEILDIFRRKKVDTWGDYIRIGQFKNNVRSLKIEDGELSALTEDITYKTEHFNLENIVKFSCGEARFSRILNEDRENKPNLLQIIKAGDFKINRICFYTQGQIAYCGYDGCIGVLSGLNDQIFYSNTHQKKVVGLSIIGEDICSIDVEGGMKITSFHKNTIINLEQHDSPAGSITSSRSGQIVTGHLDGTIRIWNIQAGQVIILRGHTGAVLAINISSDGKILSGGEDNHFRVWDIENKKVKVFSRQKDPISVMSSYSAGRIVMGLDDNRIGIVDFETNKCKILYVDDIGVINAINVYFDGRIIVGMKSRAYNGAGGNCIILDPRLDSQLYKVLAGHQIETRDCITMGPRIITCGSESNSEHTLRIWGTEFYVRKECDKLKLMTKTMNKPSYYHMLF